MTYPGPAVVTLRAVEMAGLCEALPIRDTILCEVRKWLRIATRIIGAECTDYLSTVLVNLHQVY